MSTILDFGWQIYLLKSNHRLKTSFASPGAFIEVKIDSMELWQVDVIDQKVRFLFLSQLVNEQVKSCFFREFSQVSLSILRPWCPVGILTYENQGLHILEWSPSKGSRLQAQGYGLWWSYFIQICYWANTCLIGWFLIQRLWSNL